MKINGIELEFDIFDADIAEKFEELNQTVITEAERLKEKPDMSLSDTIREQCYLVFDFLDGMFGEGASEEIFGQRVNLKKCLEAYNQVVEEVGRQKDDLVGMLPKEANATPMNRKQRRSLEQRK